MEELMDLALNMTDVGNRIPVRSLLVPGASIDWTLMWAYPLVLYIKRKSDALFQ